MNLRLSSYIHPLRKVLVHTPGFEIERLIPWYMEHPLTFDVEYTRHLPTLRQEHISLIRVLEDEIGPENVYQVSSLLTDVFQAEGEERRKILVEILGQEILDDYQTLLLKIDGQDIFSRSASDLTQDMIVGYPREWRAEESSGDILPPVVLPKDGLRHVRDAVAVLPTGVVLGAMQRLRRRSDPALMRAIFQYHPMFAGTIMYDFDHELSRLESTGHLSTPLSCSLEGGNIQVLSEDTVALGVSYAWSNANFDAQRYSFQMVVEELFRRDPQKRLQRVYVVNIPNFQHFWHLDSVFSMLGPKSALAMPYIFNHPLPLEQSLFPLVRRIAYDLALSSNYPSYPYNLPSKTDLSFSGMTEVYLRSNFERSGRAMPSSKPARGFLDQLSDDSLLDLARVVWVGGDHSNFSTHFEHIRTAFREQSSQACNIFVVRPFWVIAYEHNPFTLDALQQFLTRFQGCVKIISGLEESRSEGGPHCSTVDLERYN